jgi:hypothetical protein
VIALATIARSMVSIGETAIRPPLRNAPAPAHAVNSRSVCGRHDADDTRCRASAIETHERG